MVISYQLPVSSFQFSSVQLNRLETGDWQLETDLIQCSPTPITWRVRWRLPSVAGAGRVPTPWSARWWLISKASSSAAVHTNLPADRMRRCTHYAMLGRARRGRRSTARSSRAVTWGAPGPCAPIVADAGVTRVVVATGDPNPLVNGGGLDVLRKRGISVTTGVLADEARILNAPFFSVMIRRRPFVTMKVAVSADHRIAAGPGVRTPMTGAAAGRVIHRDRAEVDAIAVGSGTVLVDDPSLTARGAFRHRPLVRVVFDSRLRTPPQARLLSTLDAGPVIIVSTRSRCERAPERVTALHAAGAEILAADDGSTLSKSWNAWRRGVCRR